MVFLSLAAYHAGKVDRRQAAVAPGVGALLVPAGVVRCQVDFWDPSL